MRTKLVFNSNRNEEEQRKGGELANMLIDGEEVVVPSGEAFIRKLVGEGKEGELEKIRVVESKAKGQLESSKWAEVAVQPCQAQ